MEKTGAVILAAGGSTRLGRPKQLLIFQGKTLVERAVEAASDCSPIVVVAGGQAAEIAERLRGQNVEVIHHPEWERGIGSSIRLGVARAVAIAPALDSLVVLVCDQPHVTAAHIAALRDLRIRQGPPIVASVYGDSVGVPALFACELFPKLLSLSDRGGAKEIIREAVNEVAQVEFPQGAIDIDTPSDVREHLGP